MNDYLSTIVASVTFSTGSVLFIGWILRNWISIRLKNAIQSEYQLKLELYKANLKAECDLTLERAKYELTKDAAEHQVMFSRLHEKRADAIAETYARLTEVHLSLGDYVKIFSDEASKTVEDRKQIFLDTYNNFKSQYRINKIFIPKHIEIIINNLDHEIRESFYDFRYKIEMSKGTNENSSKEWLEIYKKVRDDLQTAIDELAIEFRSLLGDNNH